MWKGAEWKREYGPVVISVPALPCRPGYRHPLLRVRASLELSTGSGTIVEKGKYIVHRKKKKKKERRPLQIHPGIPCRAIVLYRHKNVCLADPIALRHRLTIPHAHTD